MTAAPCRLSHHSPRFNGKDWACPDCANDVKPSPLARLHALARSSFGTDRTDAEWSTFTSALKQAVGPGGFISQTRVRPLIQAIPHKHRGQLYRRAVKAGLIAPNGYEPSTDVRGRNTDKPQRTFLWCGKEAA